MGNKKCQWDEKISLTFNNIYVSLHNIIMVNYMIIIHRLK